MATVVVPDQDQQWRSRHRPADLLPPYEPPKTTTGAASAERFFFRLLMRMAKSASACVDVR